MLLWGPHPSSSTPSSAFSLGPHFIMPNAWIAPSLVSTTILSDDLVEFIFLIHGFLFSPEKLRSISRQQNDTNSPGLLGRKLPYNYVHLLLTVQLQRCGDQVHPDVRAAVSGRVPYSLLWPLLFPLRDLSSFFFLLFRAAPEANGGSQARG